MKRLVKLISIMLTIAYLLLIPLNSFAAVGEVSANVANPLLSRWQGYGLVDKSVTNNDLNGAIQKIDFISLINGIMKPTEKAAIGFSDVSKDSWYGEEISKAVAAGYVDNSDKTKFNPFSDITRLEAAVMVKRVFGLELNDKRLLSKIKDAEALDSKQLEDFTAVIEKGCLTQIDEGRYVPYGVLKFEDALKMLDICVGQVVTKSGTISDSVPGNMMLNTGAVTLKDMNVAGDLTVGEGVGDGDVRLDGVSVNGKLIIRGGGPNSITLTNTRIGGILVIDKSAGNVHVKTFGTTTIDETHVKSGCYLEENGLTTGKGFVDITAEKSTAENQKIDLKGDINKLTVTESNLAVTLNGKAEKVDISKGATSNFTLSAGSVKTFTSKASQNIIDILGGTVTTLNIDAGAIGNKLNISGTTTVSNVNIKENTTIALQKGTVEQLTLESNSTGSKINISSGAYLKNLTANAAATISGSGSITNAYIYSPNVSMGIKPGGEYKKTGTETIPGGTDTNSNLPKITISNVFNRTIQLGSNNQKIDARASNGAEIFYSSADSSIVAVSDKGVLTGVSAGTTNVYVSAIKNGYAPAISTITVRVISNNTSSPGTLAVSPTSGKAGESIDDFVIRYTAGESMTSGRVVIKLPAGFPASESDMFSINSGTPAALTKARMIDAYTLSFSNIALASGDFIEVKIKKVEIPTGDQFTFSAVADTDGMGPKLPAGEASCVFTVDSQKELVEGTNYSIPEYGSVTGATKIATLSFINVNSASKWIISDVVTPPVYDQILTGTAYSAGQNIQAVAGQQIMLAAVDAANKVKAYKIITIEDTMIRPDDAAALDPATISIEPGIQAGSVRLGNLNLVNGATEWMIKVQNSPSPVILIDSVFDGEKYNPGDDIKISDYQYIVLSAVDSAASKKVKAYVNLRVTGKVSVEAAGLKAPTNYSIPEIGDDLGTTKIQTLNKDNLAIDNWMVVSLTKEAVHPSLNATITDYQSKYTEGNSFEPYAQGDSITFTAGQHLLLVGVKTDTVSGTNYIQGYADMTIVPGQIRGVSAADFSGDTGVIGPLEIGTEEFTTRFSSLSLTGSAITVGATKFMYKVQSQPLAAPQLDSQLTGFNDYDIVAKTNIKPGTATYIVLLATDSSGKIKAFANVTVDKDKIRKANPGIECEFVPGAITNSTIINKLPAGKYVYKIQSNAFETIYVGIELVGTTYNPGEQIDNVSVGQHILIASVDTNGEVLAYVDKTLTASNIKQPEAKQLTQGVEYSKPEPGTIGGSTRITTLNMDGASWYYRISNAPLSTPAYNSSLPSNATLYTAGKSVTAKVGDYLTLLAVKDRLVIGFANIKLIEDQISLPELKTPDNYTLAIGSTAGTTSLKDLKFTDITGAVKWAYAVGNDAFAVPAQGSGINDLSYKGILVSIPSATTSAAITISANQYIMLLALDNSDAIKGYANIKVDGTKVKPADAPEITGLTLEKGSAEGTTRFSSLNISNINGATQWWYCVQTSPLSEKYGIDTTPPSAAKIYNYTATLKPDISVQLNQYIILFATDSTKKIKAYGVIQANAAVIQTPKAMLLTNPTNYSGPRPGSSQGTTTFTFLEDGIPDKSTGTIVWKYKTGTQDLPIPHYDEDASAYITSSNGDFTVEPNNSLLVVATIGNKVKAYLQITKIAASAIQPKEAARLNTQQYSAPVQGNNPGTTKIEKLDPIGLSSSFTGWKIQVFSSSQTFMQGTKTDNWPTYTQDSNISVKAGEYVVLAAVDQYGFVLAYECFAITPTQINPPSAAGFDNNYAGPNPGNVIGTTEFEISLGNMTDALNCVVKVSNSPINLAIGGTITLGSTTVPVTDFSNYKVYTSLADIAVQPDQYVVLIAVKNDNTILAYANIKIPASAINPGYAYQLTEYNVNTGGNYTLSAGSTTGKVAFTRLSKLGPPLGGKNGQWFVQVVTTQGTVPMMNTLLPASTTTSPVVQYAESADIDITKGNYVVLYLVDETTKEIKGYACIQVKPETLNVSTPVPGTDYFTTKIATTVTHPAGTTLMYAVKSSSSGTLLTNSTISDLIEYSGTDISAAVNQYLLLVAVDGSVIKAYKEIKITSAMLRIPNTTATLSGSLITAPPTATDMVNGGKKLIITLNDGKWENNITTTLRKTLYAGFKTTTDTGAWAYLTDQLDSAGEYTASKPYGIERTSDTVLTITFPAISATDYKITKNQIVTVTIDAACIIGDISVTAPQKITVSTVAAPAPTKIVKVSGPTGTYKQGDVIPISVEFDNIVEVAAGITPAITLKTGASTRSINYTSGSGTDTLVFNYTVQAGDYSSALTYSGTSLSPANSIKNKSTGVSAALTLPSATADNSLSVCGIVTDAVAPKFTVTPKQTTTKAETSGDITFTINETGKVYYVVLVNTGTTTVSPTVQQIVDWNATPPASVVAHEIKNASAGVSETINITDLAPNTNYNVYVIAEDGLQNRSAVTSCTVQTIDETPPVFSVSNVVPSDYSVSLVVNTNEIGNIYAVAKFRGITPPTNTAVKTDSKRVVKAVDSTNVSTNITINITGLTVSTDYDIFVVCEDKAATPNLSAVYTQPTTTKPLDLTKVDVDLANSKLLNTNALMQYSIDGGAWKDCNASTTAVTFNYTDDPDFITVQIKEKNNPTNPIQTIQLGRGDYTTISRSMIDYDIAAGTVTNKTGAGLEFRINEGTWKQLKANATVSGVVFEPGTLYLRLAVTSPTTAGSRDAKLPSIQKDVDGIPDTGSPPALTVDDTKNEIVGLNTAYHQYSTDGGVNWTSVGATVPTFPGTKKVLVRFKATTSQLPSKAQELNFTANVISVVLAPATDTQKATVKITFEENTNTPTLSKDFIRNYFQVGTWDAGGNRLTTGYWGTDSDINTVSWTGANTITITYNSMTGVDLTIGNEVRLSEGAAIQNSARTSGVYACNGRLAGTVPQIKTIKAVNVNDNSSFANGDKLVITFDQATNGKPIDANNIATYLILTDINGYSTKKWSTSGVTPSVTLDWTSNNELTIIFTDVSDTNLAVGDKIRINSTWGLKDASGTSAASTSTQVITGSFTTP